MQSAWLQFRQRIAFLTKFKQLTTNLRLVRLPIWGGPGYEYECYTRYLIPIRPPVP